MVKRKDESIQVADFKYVELKNNLSNSFNHSFKYLHKVICYKIERGVSRITGNDDVRVLNMEKIGQETKYYLMPEERSPSQNRIEVIVLETFLKEKLKLEFA